MKAFLIFLGLAAVCGAKHTQKLLLKFGTALFPWQMGKENFIPYDLNKAEAIEKGYTLTPAPETPLPELVLYCPVEDKTICLYMDDETGDLSGINIAIRKDDLSNALFDWSIQGWKNWDVQTEDGNTVSYVATQVFFCSSGFCKKSLEERVASRKKNRLFPENALWVSGLHKELDRISISAKDLEHSDFTKQNFFPMMGQHWYYKMTPKTQCRADTMHPFFVLSHKDDVVGLGLMICAKIANNTFFEDPGQKAVEFIVPRGPECLYNVMAKDGGIRTLHFFFVDKPHLELLLP